MRQTFLNPKRSAGSDLRRVFAVVVAAASLLAATTLVWAQSRTQKPQPSASAYYPERWTWETRKPEEVGMDSAALQEAAKFAVANEAKTHRDGNDLAEMLAGEPFNQIVGPTMTRGATSGLVLRNGYIVLEWGDTNRVDWTFSATKSYVATTIGLAYDAGLIRDLNDPVVRYVHDGTFSSPHNSKITWVHLLQQTSEWQGTLWGKPDWADRFDGKQRRPVLEPGSKMTYNDVRVNLAALASLHVWRKPLPVVLRELVMDPIGASPTWRWWGYDNSWVDIDGMKIQSVAGGGHWGGGLWISARDHARFGLLHLRRGKWAGKQLISEKWIQMATAPTGPNPSYGYMWWLNAGQKQLPSAPAHTFHASGGGGNYVWVDQERDLVVVTRWVPNLDGVVQRVLAAVRTQTPSAQFPQP
jgi:CubicO group peptidase (beta-lactamase class C family)